MSQSTPKSYTIIISEEQRKALLEVLTGAAVEEHMGNNLPLEYWDEMLDRLPKDEAETPGTHHGFCL